MKKYFVFTGLLMVLIFASAFSVSSDCEDLQKENLEFRRRIHSVSSDVKTTLILLSDTLKPTVPNVDEDPVLDEFRRVKADLWRLRVGIRELKKKNSELLLENDSLKTKH